MDLDDIKLAADIVFRICKEHPEICPHYYNEHKPKFHGTNADGKWEHRYICELCGTEIVKVY